MEWNEQREKDIKFIVQKLFEEEVLLAYVLTEFRRIVVLVEHWDPNFSYCAVSLETFGWQEHQLHFSDMQVWLFAGANVERINVDCFAV